VIVAIYQVGAGLAPVEEYRSAVDVAAAVAAFVSEHSPPLTGYTGLDTGWSVYQDPGNRKVWNVDRDAVALVIVDEVPALVFVGGVSIVSLPAVAVTSISWAPVGGVVTSVNRLVDDSLDAVGNVTGQVKVAGGSLLIRLSKGDPASPISAEYSHSDTAGLWQPFGLLSDQPPDPLTQIYVVEAKLSASSVTAEVRYTTLSIFDKDW